MFKAQFKLMPEERGLRDACVFAVCIYLKAWISAPQASGAPYSDFALLKSLLEYFYIHSAISKQTSRKVSNHLWYLSEELVGLLFFDDLVSSSTKGLMVRAMQNEEEQDNDNSKRITIALDSFKDKNLDDFVKAKLMTLFRMMELPHGFLAVDPYF